MSGGELGLFAGSLVCVDEFFDGGKFAEKGDGAAVAAEASGGGHAVFFEGPELGFLELDVDTTGALEEAFDELIGFADGAGAADFFEFAFAAEDFYDGVEVFLSETC